MFIATFNNVPVFYQTSAVCMGVQDAHALCHFQYSVIYHTITIGRGFRRLMCYATFNNVLFFYHTCTVVRAFKRIMFYATFNMQSFTTHLLLARGFNGLMVYATFNIVSVIYNTCAIGRGVQEAHAFCNFQ
jgi:hypothetical protein